MSGIRSRWALLGLSLVAAVHPVRAQSLGPSTGGLVALDQSLRFLGHNKRVLMIGAHPDDEDTELLTVLARGMGAEAAYLSLTRGEGGQNLIGTELGPALGVLRTEELLAARALDGARQYFTRAYDFGFSKSLADTWRFWPSDSVLKDVVRIVRRFQPQVIVSIFSGTPNDGHGQHQAAGWAARQAFEVAGNPNRFPELEREENLAAWQPLKLYQSARFGAEGTLVLQGGVLDRAVGQSYLQIAMRGRSLHRSQDMGAAQRIGPSPIQLRLLNDRTGKGTAGFFDGVDTTLAGGLGQNLPRPTVDSITRALLGLSALDLAGLEPLRARFAALIGPEREWTPTARDQMRRLDEAMSIASGVLCDAVTPSDRVIAGSTATVVLSCWNPSLGPVEISAQLSLAGTPATRSAARRLDPGRLAADTISVRVPPDASPTEPYYLRLPMNGSLYTWPESERERWGVPFEPPPLLAEFTVEGRTVQREVQYRYVDQALGEVRRPVFLAPRVNLAVEPATGFWPRSPVHTRDFTVRLRHLALDSTAGTVTLEVPDGWRVTTRPQSFTLAGRNDQNVLSFKVQTGGAPTSGRFQVRASDRNGRSYATGVMVVDYPHIHPRQLTRPAEVRVSVTDLRLPPQAVVGYVRGAADRIPESLSTLGLNLVLLNRDSLARGGLARYRSIVIGPRAYETEPALELYNGRLLEYVRNGGTLIVQYQQQPYFRGNFAPFPLSLTEKLGETPARVAAARVAQEDAPVTVLEPAHPVFTAPNRLQETDWSGWVQERGLYFARSWSTEWTPLLQMADSGEAPQRGALLVARSGRGVYVYTGISFFRQLPAAVPGAVRLFLNLLALK